MPPTCNRARDPILPNELALAGFRFNFEERKRIKNELQGFSPLEIRLLASGQRVRRKLPDVLVAKRSPEGRLPQHHSPRSEGYRGLQVVTREAPFTRRGRHRDNQPVSRLTCMQSHLRYHVVGGGGVRIRGL